MNTFDQKAHRCHQTHRSQVAYTSTRPLRCAHAVQTTEAVTTIHEASKPEPTGRLARLKASKLGAQQIQESQKPLAEYMSLPASQYSVLDARTIERIDDETFRCYVGQLKMFGWSAEPVLTVSVTVEQGGCTIRLLSCENGKQLQWLRSAIFTVVMQAIPVHEIGQVLKIKGSPLVEDINRKFTAQMVNQVRWRTIPASESTEEGKEIVSNTSLEVVLQIPGWCGFLSTESIENVGSSMLQNVLNVMVPRFLKQLQTDYRLWATGKPRKPVDS